MRTAGPAARTAFAGAQLVEHPRDVLPPGRSRLHDRYPANPFVARELRDVFPCGPGVGIRAQRVAHIVGQIMYNAARELWLFHAPSIQAVPLDSDRIKAR